MIKVNLSFPLLEEIDEWQGAFICSSSRSIVNIGKLRIRDGEKIKKEVVFGVSGDVKKLQTGLADYLQRKATKVVEKP